MAPWSLRELDRRLALPARPGVNCCRTHEAYGKALGIAEPLPESPAPVTVEEPLLALRRALKRYALQVIATADEDSPASVEAVVRALAPIEEARPLRTRATPPVEGEPTPA